MQRRADIFSFITYCTSVAVWFNLSPRQRESLNENTTWTAWPKHTAQQKPILQPLLESAFFFFFLPKTYFQRYLHHFSLVTT